MGNFIKTINCTCLSPISKKNKDIVLNYDSYSELKKENNISYTSGRLKKNEINNNLEVTEMAKSGIINNEPLQCNCNRENVKNPTNEFEDALMSGLEVSPGQVPPKLSEKILEIEKEIGKFELSNKEKEFVSNLLLKKFTILYEDNKIYDGQYNKKWEKEGYGYLYFPDGSKYEGLFNNDHMLRGRLINFEDDYYEGKLY